MFLDDQPKVCHHEPNAKGRDFIVGDLHGCRAMLDALLEHVAFDATQDRLFSTGDLVDRGPDSIGCLELLKEPWFFPVLGNHDAMFLAWILGNRREPKARLYEQMFVHNSGWEWANRFTRAAEFLPLLQKIPLVRVVGPDTPQRFNLVHAELIGSSENRWTDVDLDSPSETPWIKDTHWIIGLDDKGNWIDHVLWGRSLNFALRNDMPIESDGLSTTYCGHTILPPSNHAVFRFGQHVFLDGGAFAAHSHEIFGLILWNPVEDRGWIRKGNGDIREIA